jgi:hypothetical protein
MKVMQGEQFLVYRYVPVQRHRVLLSWVHGQSGKEGPYRARSEEMLVSVGTVTNT